MTIAVLCYDTAEVDIIRNAPEMNAGAEVEEWLANHCQYYLDEIYYMVADNIKINDLTPEDFG